MSFLDTIERARAFLERAQRVSLRALRREFGLDEETLDELIEELVDVQRVARRVYTGRRSGTLPSGAEFVSDFLVVAIVERGLATRLEVFEPDAADAALARFAALRPARTT